MDGPKSMKNLTAKQMFKPIQSGKVAQNIRCQIEDAILSGEISLGERLPPARELQHVFQASRSTVREALKVLEQKGMVEIRAGSAGGTYVKVSSGEKIGEGLAMLFKLGQVTVRQLFEFRELNEAMAFESAVHNATDEEISELRLLLESLRKTYCRRNESTYENFFTIEQEMHKKVLTMANNPLSKWVLETTITHTWRYLVFTWETLAIETSDKTTIMKTSLEDWGDIVGAFEDRNSLFASSLIRSHLINYYRAFKNYLRQNDITETDLIGIVHKENKAPQRVNTQKKSRCI
jgi:DNA-binding FadR family transcriptional regulator